jgi:SAM-dependent methyltransferase
VGEVFRALRDCVDGLPKDKLLLAEAAYGIDIIRPYLDAQAAGARVLEVGSGPAILLAHFTQAYEGLHFTGIEPVGAGFATSELFIQRLAERFPMRLERCGYQQFSSSQLFDLIFLINVFEHLPDWRDFLDFAERNLKIGGQCVIFCPNYGFPYESHFGLPIIGSKRLTGRLFRKRIAKHERERNADGLWKSLNFVTWAQLLSSLTGSKLRPKFDLVFLEHMVKRLQTDPEFRRRQSGIAFAARMAASSGLLRALRWKPLWRYHPYMHVTLTRTG